MIFDSSVDRVLANDSVANNVEYIRLFRGRHN